MTKLAHKKGRRACCFCGGFNLSKEHIWPQWAAPYLPEGRDHVRTKFKGWGRTARTVSEWARQGATKTIRIYTVCRSCNSGWMSDMEQAVRPWLEPILKRQSVEMTIEGQCVLTRYFTLKAMVADQSQEGENVFSKDERKAFFEKRNIPEITSITLYRYIHEIGRVAQYNKENYGYIMVQKNGGWQRNGIANLTFRFSELFIQVLLLRNVGVELKAMPGFELRIHPPMNNSLRWPPLFRLGTGDAHTIQHVLEATLGSADS